MAYLRRRRTGAFDRGCRVVACRCLFPGRWGGLDNEVTSALVHRQRAWRPLFQVDFINRYLVLETIRNRLDISEATAEEISAIGIRTARLQPSASPEPVDIEDGEIPPRGIVRATDASSTIALEREAVVPPPAVNVRK